MAIANANMAYRTQGPSFSGQIMASSNLSDTEVALVGTATLTLDGTSTSATVNFIDGTQTLSFVPSGVIACVVGGTQTTFTGVSTRAATNTSFTVNLSAAGTASNTVVIAFIVLK